MDLEATQRFLLVQAVEETDRDGSVIPFDDREMVARDGSQGSSNGGEDFLLRRSERLYKGLVEEHPLQVRAALAASGAHSWIKVAVVVVALLVGLATKQLGPERRINVLAFPLFGLLAWNILIYGVSLVGAVFRREASPGGAALGGVVQKLSERVVRRLESGGDRVLATGLSRFVARWFELTAKIRVVRAGACLHLGAAALSVGVVAGMYWNGLAYQYLAAWESTFLSPDGVSGLFAVLFAPASIVSGIGVPGLDEIRSMELKTGAEGVAAANWIHLFAVTVGLVVVVPRLLMALMAHRKATALEGAIDYREAAGSYVERLLRTREGGNLVTHLVPHRMELGSKDRDRLRAFVHRLWGGQMWVEFSDPIGYGDEDEAVFKGGDYQVLVMNLSTTPEDESQGNLVARFRKQLSGVGLVLLEAQPFRERFGGLGEFERRLAERRGAWKAVLGRAGVGFALIDEDTESAALAAAEVLLKPRKSSDAIND